VGEGDGDGKGDRDEVQDSRECWLARGRLNEVGMIGWVDCTGVDVGSREGCTGG